MASKILILCTGNSCRSQMAEGFLKSFGPGLEVYSAGTHPAVTVHPKAVAVMKEAGIDISSASTKNVEQFLNASFDYVITVCDNAKETCPVFSGKVSRRLHFSFEDPAETVGREEEVVAKFRTVRDQIKEVFFRFYKQELSSN
jgi:arsenate reductase (thioredoxin)